MCAGYELGEWRHAQLARHMMEWLPDFALNFSEKSSVRSYNAAALLSKAATVVYSTDKYKRRGEIGELLLHIAIRQVFDTMPAVSKYYYKDAANDTVKGFDAVHVVVSNDSLQLWLGESKFYDDVNSAINDAIDSINDHMQRDYLRAEFVAIVNKLDPQWPHFDRLKSLLDPNNSLDNIFDAICIPVFVSYNSPVMRSHTEVTESFKAQFEAEVRKHHASFCSNHLPDSIIVHLFLFPMKDKTKLQQEFDKRLKTWQTILT